VRLCLVTYLHTLQHTFVWGKQGQFFIVWGGGFPLPFLYPAAYMPVGLVSSCWMGGRPSGGLTDRTGFLSTPSLINPLFPHAEVPKKQSLLVVVRVFGGLDLIVPRPWPSPRPCSERDSLSVYLLRLQFPFLASSPTQRRGDGGPGLLLPVLLDYGVIT
jgi:hypothetical protein